MEIIAMQRARLFPEKMHSARRGGKVDVRDRERKKPTFSAVTSQSTPSTLNL